MDKTSGRKHYPSCDRLMKTSQYYFHLSPKPGSCSIR